jgi:hypothetical protein
VKIFDPHVHMYARTTDDYERMALAGIERIIEPAFWLGQPRTRAGTFFDYFEHMLDFETQRAAQYGVDHWVTIALNPREANDERLRREVLAEMPRYLDHPRCVAVGEVGFDKITDAEEEALRAQLTLARERRLPVLVHTPHHRKREGTERTLRVLADMDYDMDMVLMDHNTEETTGISQAARCWCGHTIYPITKLSPERACNILAQYGTRKMLINSSADWGPSDPLMVPKTVREMTRRGFPASAIEEVVWTNPNVFFGKSTRMHAR